MINSYVGDSETQATKQRIISQMVQMELAANNPFTATVRDVSEFAEPGAKSIDFPRTGSFEQNKIKGNEKAQSQALNYVVDNLPLDEWAEITWVIRKKDNLQSRVNLEADLAGRAGSGHSRGVGLDIMDSMYSNYDSSNNQISLGGGKITKTKILDIMTALDEQDVPREGRTMGLSPARHQEILNIDDFVHADKYGSGQSLVTGELGTIYGMRVVMSNLFNSDKFDGKGSIAGFVYHRDGLALGFQQDPEFEEEYSVENKGWIQSIDQLYGLKTLQQGAMIAAFTAS